MLTYLTINTTIMIIKANRIIPANTPPNREPESTSDLRSDVPGDEAEKKYIMTSLNESMFRFRCKAYMSYNLLLYPLSLSFILFY